MPQNTDTASRLGDLAVDTWFTLTGPFDMWRVKNHWTTGVEIVQASSWAERRVLSPDTAVTEL